ncbi:MAG: RNA methyltransferase [Eubacterium sp.]|nr:RNA methyltransferase [Eubacterium sp.]
MIETTSNGQIKKIIKLSKSASFRRKESTFICEGWKMTGEALARGLAKKLYIGEKNQENWRERLMETNGTIGEEVAKNMVSTPVEIVSDKVFSQLSDTVTPQGVLALVEMPSYDREEILRDPEARLICLEDIQDPGNLGTIMRTAEGAGMTALVMTQNTVDLFNPKVVRATMGGLFRLPFYVCQDMTTEVESLKKAGFTSYAAHLKGRRDFKEEAYQGKTAILIGNEAKGLQEATAKAADCLVKIPMEGQLESLNAAVSAALFMYEVHRKNH